MIKLVIREEINNEFSIKLDIYDSYKGWSYGTIKTTINNQLLGTVDFQINSDETELHIDMINVNKEFRNRGIASNMLRNLQLEYPEAYIEWGYTTEDGTQLKNKLTTQLINPEWVRLNNELQNITTQLNKLTTFLDNVDYDNSNMDVKKVQKLGDKWNDLYDTQRELEDHLLDVKKHINKWKT